MIISTFSEFVTASASYAWTTAPKNWRSGQAAFNLLCRVRPDLSEMVRGSDFDPFYDDSNLLDFFDFLARHWNDGEA